MIHRGYFLRRLQKPIGYFSVKYVYFGSFILILQRIYPLLHHFLAYPIVQFSSFRMKISKPYSICSTNEIE